MDINEVANAELQELFLELRDEQVAELDLTDPEFYFRVG